MDIAGDFRRRGALMLDRGGNGGADLVDWIERIPYDETRDYVMRVAENYGVYQARLAEAPELRAAGVLAKR